VSEPRVGVVILTHDRREQVIATLTRMLALPERPPIVVVDNASTDGTASALARRFPGIEVLRLDENRGAAGRNAGIRRLATPYVALCDDDTWWAAGAVTRAADLLDAHPRLAVVSGRVLVGADEREDPTCVAMATSPVPASGPGLPGSPLLGFLAGASAIRRSAFLDVGGFEPRFFIGGEEKLLAVDLATAGWAMAYVPEVTVHHHPSPSRDGSGRRRLLVRNALWFAWLRRPTAIALRETATIADAARSDGIVAAGCAEALAGIEWVLRARRVVPAPVEAALRLLDDRFPTVIGAMPIMRGSASLATCSSSR